MAAEPTETKTQPVADTPQELDVNPGMAIERLDAWLDGAVRMAPNILIAIGVLALFYFASKLAQNLVMKWARRNNRPNLGQVLGGFIRAAVILAGLLLAVTIVFPSVKPVDLIAGLGVSSVAIGFAFKDILQNWMAGLLILLRQPFEIDDQIRVDDYEGTVQKIETRATIIKTYDGQKVVIPNSEVYTNSVLVKTGHAQRRSQYDIGIGYGDSIDEAKEVIEGVLQKVEGVASDPAPEVLPWDLAASWVTLRARWWTDSRQASVVHTYARVIHEVKKALDEAGIDMPFETRVELLHDQTEEFDGNRSEQREGWPDAKSGATRPQWKAREQGAASDDGAQAA
ncbi:MAG: mechanosensitive ion channel family protein [Gammaproteobacteria bacterium]|nr:mechanosensitive ion channel family protein [Gammaproteobacteria bacterium]